MGNKTTSRTECDEWNFIKISKNFRNHGNASASVWWVSTVCNQTRDLNTAHKEEMNGHSGQD